MKILLVSNTAWSIFNFRLNIIRAFQANGFEVHVAAPADSFSQNLLQAGCRFHPIYIDSKGKNLFRDLRSIRSLRSLYQSVAPDIIINYTIKPVIYGLMAARPLKIPVISVITGLGSPFTSRNISARMIEGLLKITQRHAEIVFFLNRDDLGEMTSRRVIDSTKARLLPSEGIDLSHFAPSEPANSGGNELSFLFAGRLLWEKGVGHFVEAARIVRRERPDIVFKLLGPCGVNNASALTEAQVQAWHEEGVIQYLGNTSDVRPFIAGTDCVVLPSFYREGVPRILMEAAAMAKPIITTDMPGCRDVVEDNVSGLLCRANDPQDLARKMLKFSAMEPAERKLMGIRGRLKMEQEFDEELVIAQYKHSISHILGNQGAV